jgi:aminoglycoside 3-N-acetyltransferase
MHSASRTFPGDAETGALTEQLRRLGLQPGATVLVHVSLRTVGPVTGGAHGLLRALQGATHPGGTIVVPAFYWGSIDPACWRDPPQGEELVRARAALVAFTPGLPPADDLGVFPQVVHRTDGARRSPHPAMSFLAVGAHAEEITGAQALERAYGDDGPLGALSRLDGFVLLLGVGFASATSVHCAEDQADLPYLLRDSPVRYKTGADRWTESLRVRDYGCSDGFAAVESVLRSRSQVADGRVGLAASMLARHRDVVAAARALLRHNPAALLCTDATCAWCSRARRLLAQSM